MCACSATIGSLAVGGARRAAGRAPRARCRASTTGRRCRTTARGRGRSRGSRAPRSARRSRRRAARRSSPGEPTLGSTPCSSTTVSALSRNTSAVSITTGGSRAHREAGAARAQHLVAADGVDPEPGGAHRLQHLPGRVRLHRVARLQRVARRSAPPARPSRRRELCAVVEVERRADLVGEARRADRTRDRATAWRAGRYTSSARGADPTGDARSTIAEGRRGSTTVNAAPAPGTLWTLTRPPSALTSSFVIQRPAPRPNTGARRRRARSGGRSAC